MTGRELIKWLTDADELLAADVLGMEIEFRYNDSRVSEEPIDIEVAGASVQGDKIQLY